MQKNFVQRHALFFSVIVFCFVIVPFIRNAYAQEKADKKQQAETLVIRTQKQAEEKKVTKRRVVLDAGHGGYDDGSVAADGTKEKNITLQLTKKIGKLLEKQDVDVVYTRVQDKVSWPSDNEKDLLERSRIANTSKADYFISIHMIFSDTAQDSARGAEIWVRESDAKSRALAKQVNKQLTGLKGMKSRGLKDEADAPLSLMEYTDIPTILVEAGFLSNDGDLSYLKSEKNQEAMAKAIADGIVHAFDKES